jgi:hypothetical protein
MFFLDLVSFLMLAIFKSIQPRAVQKLPLDENKRATTLFGKANFILI